MSDKTKQELRDKILAEKKNGNIVHWGLPGELMVAPLEQFLTQPAEGILYDLNRLEEISLTFLDHPKWVNDFAVALVIRKLVEQRDHLAEALRPFLEQIEAEYGEGEHTRKARAALAELEEANG